MTGHKKNQFRSGPPSVEYTRGPRTGRPSSDDDEARGGRRGPSRGPGRDRGPRAPGYRHDEYASPTAPVRRDKPRPQFRGSFEQDHEGPPPYKPPVASFPRTEAYPPRRDVPEKKPDYTKAVEASALIGGLRHSKTEITTVLREFAAMATTDYRVNEIELSLSFGSDGRFLGFGTGGATSVKIRIAPKDK
jgi:hypothetical protein